MHDLVATRYVEDSINILSKGRILMKNLEKENYLIGEVSKICNIPKKTLRYYDSIDVIKPKKTSEYSGYRYYSVDNMQDIIILKYFKQMGYSLSEIRDNFNSHNLDFISSSLRDKTKELNKNKRSVENKIKATMDWNMLINEACDVLSSKDNTVKIVELAYDTYPCLTQKFDYDYKASIINVPWVKALEMNDEEITGPVILHFGSYKNKMLKKSNQATVLQKGLNNFDNKLDKIRFGGKFLSTYHIGRFDNIYLAYERMESFAKEKDISFKQETFERYVVDYWTTSDETLFVTQILIPIIQ